MKDNKNDPMFDYTVDQYIIASKKSKRLCKPLLDSTIIAHTGYSWCSDDDSSVIMISSNQDLLSEVLRKRLYISLFKHTRFSDAVSGYFDTASYVETQENKQALSELQAKYPVHNTFSIIKKHKDYLDLYSIAFEKPDGGNVRFYLNKRDDIDKFFLSITPEIHALCKSLVPLLMEYQETKDFDISDKFTSMVAENFQGAQNNLKNVELTEREKSILYECLCGKRPKEISQALNLSHRTVEVYLQRIKEKFSCQSVNHLLSLFINPHQFHF